MKRNITNEFVLALRTISVSKVQNIIKSLRRIEFVLERLSEAILVKSYYLCVYKFISRQYEKEKRTNLTAVVLYAESRKTNQYRRY